MKTLAEDSPDQPIIPAVDKAPSATSKIKADFILSVIGYVSLFMLLVLFAALVFHFYKPDIEAIRRLAASLTIMEGGFTPKPQEKIIYFFSLLFLPLGLYFYFRFISDRILNHLPDKYVGHLYILFFLLSSYAIIALLLLDLITIPTYNTHREVSNFVFYFEFNLIRKYPFVLLLLLLPATHLLIRYSSRFESGHNHTSNAFFYYVLNFIYYGLVVILLFLPIFMNIFSKYYFYIHSGHFEAVFYSTYDALSNSSDFHYNTYGFYPFFLKPVFQLIGCNVLTFTTTIAILLGLSYYFIFRFFTVVVENKWVSLLGLGTIIFWYIFSQVDTHDPYFQYAPLRTFFPCVFLFLMVKYFQNHNIGRIYLCAFISAFACLWNYESGIVVFITFLLSTLYDIAASRSEIRDKIKKVLLYGCGSILMALVIGWSFIKFAMHQDDPLRIISMQYTTANTFFGLGYYMIPMEFFHPWNIVVFAYAAGLLIAIKKLVKGETDLFARSVFMLSILGLGVFTYYTGRSHNSTFYGPLYPFIILLTLFADKIRKKVIVEELKLPHYVLAYILILLFLSSSFYSLALHVNGVRNQIRGAMNTVFKAEPGHIINEKIKFVRDHSGEKEKIFIFSHMQGVLLSESKRYSAFSPGFIDLILKEDYKKLLISLVRDNYKVFVDGDYGYYNLKDIINDYFALESSSEAGAIKLYRKSRDFKKSYSLGQTITAESDNFFVYGWSKKENSQRRMDGKESLILLPINDLIYKDKYQITIKPLLTSGSQTALVIINGKQIGSIVLNAGQRSSIDFDSNILKTHDLNLVELQIPDAGQANTGNHKESGITLGEVCIN